MVMTYQSALARDGGTDEQNVLDVAEYNRKMQAQARTIAGVGGAVIGVLVLVLVAVLALGLYRKTKHPAFVVAGGAQPAAGV